MPLPFLSRSHGAIAFGFFNIESHLLILDQVFFFANGTSGQWETGLTEAQKAAFDARFAAMVPDAEQAAWMLNGHG